MTKNSYRYEFDEIAPAEDIEAALLLAVWGCEALYGEAQVRLDASYHFDTELRTCVIDSTTVVGRDFNRLFISFVQRELGRDAFRVSHVAKSNPEFAT